MRDTTVFLKLKRRPAGYRPIAERLKDYEEVSPLREEAASSEQASRCVACAVPFCHWRCPIGNYIPDWNDFLATGQWREAYRALSATNDLPEITGRVCPAFCENGCILEPDGQAVTIRENELAVIEHAFEAGLVVPEPPSRRTDKTVAVVGSGPAGLSCAAQLNRAGHRVTVFERDEKLGGILRYGIPDFKLEKWIIDRRVEIWKKEGVEFLTGVEVGADFPVEKLLTAFDAVCLAGGSRLPRDLKVEGRQLRGIHFAMDFLTQSNRRVAGETVAPEKLIDAKGKRVVVLGGGDTGADCVGTSHRQGARQVTQVELLPKPPASRQAGDRWPRDPHVLKTSSSHEEGGIREWAVMTKRFLGENGSVKKLSCVRVDKLQEIPGTDFEIEADLVLLAMGFLSPEPAGMLGQLGLKLDPRGNVQTGPEQLSSHPGVFCAGDMRRGQSLVVWAVSEGRRAAHFIDRYLMGRSSLPLI